MHSAFYPFFTFIALRRCIQTRMKHNLPYKGCFPLLFLARSIVFPIWNKRFTVTITDQTFHFVPTSVSIMIYLLMTTFETSSRKVKFAVHNVSCIISLGFKYKPLFLYQILPVCRLHFFWKIVKDEYPRYRYDVLSVV